MSAAADFANGIITTVVGVFMQKNGGNRDSLKNSGCTQLVIDLSITQPDSEDLDNFLELMPDLHSLDILISDNWQEYNLHEQRLLQVLVAKRWKVIYMDCATVHRFLPVIQSKVSMRLSSSMVLDISDRWMPAEGDLSGFCAWLANRDCPIKDLRLYYHSTEGADLWLAALAVPQTPPTRLRHVEIGQSPDLPDGSLMGKLPDLRLLQSVVIFKSSRNFTFSGMNFSKESQEEFVTFLKTFHWQKSAVRLTDMTLESNIAKDPRLSCGKWFSATGHCMHVLIGWTSPHPDHDSNQGVKWNRDVAAINVAKVHWRGFLNLANRELPKTAEGLHVDRCLNGLTLCWLRDKVVPLLQVGQEESCDSKKPPAKKPKHDGSGALPH